MDDRASAPRLAEILNGWEGRAVAVRLVVEPDELVAVFTGVLGARSAGEHPPWFWPVEPDGRPLPTVERRGIYLHPELLSHVELHVNGSVLEYAQGSVIVNLRGLEPASR